MVVEKGYKQTDIGGIPEDWDMKMLGEVVKVIGGGTPSTNNKSFWNGSINWFTPTEIGSNKYVSSSNRKISEAGYNNSSATLLPQGTILLTSRAGIGDAAILLNEATTNQGFQSLLAGEKVYNEFLYYLILSKKGDLLRLASGSTFLEISPAKVKSIIIPCPSLPEQTAIANALSDMDALITQTEKLIEKKKAIKQGVMQELLKPKEGWVMKKLGENALILRGGSPRPIEDYLTTSSDGINWIKIGDVGKNAKYITSTEEKITPDGMSRSRVVKPGDFLLSNSMSFGRPYIMQIDGCIHDGWLVITEYESNFDRDFLYYVLGSEAVFTQYKSMASGSSVLNLNKEIVKEVNVACPKNLDEQVHIARILSDIDIDLDYTELKLLKLKHQKQGMMQALLTGKIRLI